MKKSIFKFDFQKVLWLFTSIPLLSAVITLSIVMISISSKEVKEVANNSMLAVVDNTGVAMDEYFNMAEETLQSFTTAPIVTEFLKNPSDPTLAAKAQQYTTDFFGSLKNWEGIYIADWNSKVLTHPAPPVVGRVMREGDRLEELRNGMLNADGVFNLGIITSPASGELIISMYLPVYDNGKPIGYVGAGTFIAAMDEMYSDVSGLGYDTAYMYVVDRDGIMVFHPNPDKIGQPVENEVVKGLVSKIQSGNHPDPACVTYNYKGANKFAAYYVGLENRYIAVVTADETDVVKDINTMTIQAIVVSLIILAIFMIIAVIIARVIAKPLSAVVKALKSTSEGDLNADTNIKTVLFETKQLVSTAALLQTTLQDIIGKTKGVSSQLADGAEVVTDLSAQCLESTSQISMAMEELAGGATAIATSAQNINEKVGIMGVAIEEIASNSDELTKNSNRIKESNEEAAEYIAKVSESSDKSVEAVKNISNQIAETNSAITRIKSASEMIREIASQTNLLALNASIEAARAGEAGRGFAVVAEEIKNLSEQSNRSAEEINDVVKEIVEKSEQSVELSAQVADMITAEKEYISETQNKFTILNDEVINSIREIESISEKVDALNESKNVILDSVTDLSAVSEENAASNEEVSASIHEVTSAVENIANNAKATKSDSADLIETVSYFA